MSWLPLLIAGLCGIVVGILAGIFGIGGGILVIPLMRIGFGFPGLVAAGTSLFTILFTSGSGIIGRLRSKTVSIGVGACVGIGGMILTPVGSWLSEQVGGAVVMIVTGAIIAYTGIRMLVKTILADKGKKKIEAVSLEDLKLTKANAAKAIAVGAIGGFASGFVGLGGGFIITPVLMWIFKMSLKDASGTTLMSILLIAIPGAISHGILGHISYLYGLAIAAGSIIGAQIGSRLVTKIPEHTLRIIFAIFLFSMGFYLALNEIL